MTKTLSPPEGPLTQKKLSCRSAEDLDNILRAMSWIDDRTKTVEAQCRQEVAAVTAKHQANLRLEVAGESIPFADRRQQLEAAARAYCEGHRDALLDGSKKKSRDFTWGSIAWRATPAALVCAEGKTESDVVEGITKKAGLIAFVERMLAKKLFGVPLLQLVKVEIKLSKAAIKAAAIPAATLKRFGLTWTEAGESLSIKPAEYTVASEQSRAA